MQLDQTHVVIRARTLTEIADLAMVLIRAYPSAAIFGFAIGALPWAIANYFLLSYIPLDEFSYATYDEDMDSALFRYQLLMAILVFLQAPIAGILTTIYVGQAVFETRPTWRSVFQEARKTFGRWLTVLGIYRGPIPAMLFIVSSWAIESVEFEVIWPVFLAMGAMLMRSTRPFMPEIIALERCPLLVRGSSQAITASRRSTALHRPMTGELFGRFISIGILVSAIAVLGLYSLLWARGIFLGQWEWDAWVYVFLYPMALWAAAALSVLVRFLSYLDTRIRLEGWEVQLAVRAEAIRQFGEDDSSEVSKITTPEPPLRTTLKRMTQETVSS